MILVLVVLKLKNLKKESRLKITEKSLLSKSLKKEDDKKNMLMRINTFILKCFLYIHIYILHRNENGYCTSCGRAEICCSSVLFN